MTSEQGSNMPIEGQSMRDVVHHIMNVGARQASADFQIENHRKQITEGERFYGKDPTRLWNRGLMVSIVHYWQREVVEPGFLENPAILALTESNDAGRKLARERTVDEQFISRADDAMQTIQQELTGATDRLLTSVDEMSPEDKRKQFFDEYEAERLYRKYRLFPPDERANPIRDLIIEGAGTSLGEVRGLLGVHMAKHNEEGRILTANEAADLLIIASASHVSPLLKVRHETFDKVRRRTREIERFSVEENILGNKPTDNFYPETFMRTGDGRIYPLGNNNKPMNLYLPTDRRFRDRDGCPAGYPTSMTNEFYPGQEASKGGPAINLYLHFAEVIRHLKV